MRCCVKEMRRLDVGYVSCWLRALPFNSYLDLCSWRFVYNRCAWHLPEISVRLLIMQSQNSKCLSDRCSSRHCRTLAISSSANCSSTLNASQKSVKSSRSSRPAILSVILTERKLTHVESLCADYILLPTGRSRHSPHNNTPDRSVHRLHRRATDLCCACSRSPRRSYGAGRLTTRGK